MAKDSQSAVPVEICILAGGLSSRMGRDKSKLRLNGKSLLAQIRATAKTVHIPVRVIRRDLVPRCGPLGGVFTALKTSKKDAVLFLACDMPLVSTDFLKHLLAVFYAHPRSVFSCRDTCGFPFVLSRSVLPLVEALILEKQFSLQALAARSKAKKFKATRRFNRDFLNLNTPEDFAALIKLFPEKN